MDCCFNFFSRFAKCKRNFIFQQLSCRIIKLAFQNRKLFYLTAVIKTADNCCNVLYSSLFKKVKIHLIAEFPVRGNRFKFIRQKIECFFSFLCTYNLTDTEFFCLINRNHDNHIGSFNINLVIKIHLFLKFFLKDFCYNANTLAWIHDLLVNLKFCFHI